MYSLKKRRKRIISLLFLLFFFFCFLCSRVCAALPLRELDVSAPSAVLMEASTGQVIYQKDATQRRSPASITKIMTLLLIFDELKTGNIHLEDPVTTSAYAKSMGGSQVFLEEGEIQTVETLIKCIAVASGNDASVAMAEYIDGSEEEFVRHMNQKANELGLKDTHFVDCCGLTDSSDHYTSALDVALMSRTLITSHPEIYKYTNIWMEDITHETAKGESQFTLSSTNKLLKQYEYTTGLKTGSTSLAKYCFSATARKNNIDLIAVVMAAPEPKGRFLDAKEMLEYGFAISSLYEDNDLRELPPLTVIGGKKDVAKIVYDGQFRFLDTTGMDLSHVRKEIELDEKVIAPMEKGHKVGQIAYFVNEKQIGTLPICLEHDIEKATYKDVALKVLNMMLF